jgi:hypothetical protein
MKKLLQFKFIFIKLIFILILTNCSTAKIDGGKLISKNVPFYFDNSGLATFIKGNGKIDVYENKLKIRIKEGSIKINPEFDNPTYTVGEIYLSLGKYIEKEKGRWKRYNHSKSIKIDKKINSLKDSIDISNLKFEIPHNNNSDLIDSWIIITTTDKERRGLNHSHSTNRFQKFN